MSLRVFNPKVIQRNIIENEPTCNITENQVNKILKTIKKHNEILDYGQLKVKLEQLSQCQDNVCNPFVIDHEIDEQKKNSECVILVEKAPHEFKTFQLYSTRWNVQSFVACAACSCNE